MPAPMTTTLLALGAIAVAASAPVFGLVVACLALIFELVLFVISGSDDGLG